MGYIDVYLCQNLRSIYYTVCKSTSIKNFRAFPGGAVVKNPPANAGDMDLNPGLGRSHMPRSN